MLVNLPINNLEIWYRNFIYFFYNKTILSKYSNCLTCLKKFANETNIENNCNNELETKVNEFSTMSTLRMGNDIYFSNLIDSNFSYYGDQNKNNLINEPLDEGIFIFLILKSLKSLKIKAKKKN